jgi:hypothetical protein
LVEPDQIDLSGVKLPHGGFASRRLSVRNPGPKARRVAVDLEGDGASLQENSCATLAAGGTCSLQVAFGAGELIFPDTKELTGTIRVGDVGVPYSGVLSSEKPQASVEPSRFSIRGLEGEPLSQVVEVTNQGLGALRFGPLRAEQLPAFVNLSNRCTGTLLPRQQCAIAARVLLSQGPGEVRTQLKLEHNAGTLAIPLDATVNARRIDLATSIIPSLAARETRFRGRVRITGRARSSGNAAYEARRAPATLEIVSTSPGAAARVLTRQNVPNLEPGQEVAVDTTVDWLTSHEFPPQFTVRLVWSSNARDASASNDTANLDSTRIDAVFVDQATRGSEDGPD